MIDGISVRDPVIRVAWEHGGDINKGLSQEWLVTNGLGGYASGTVMQVATRRYHGIFVPDLPSPFGRTMVLPRLDEELESDGTIIRLSGAEYADGRLETDLPKYLTSFDRSWQTPIWRFSCDGREILKRLIMPYGQNTVYVEYVLQAGESAVLRLRPFITFRMPDDPLGSTHSDPFLLTVLRERYEFHLHEGVAPLKLCMRPHAGVFVLDPLTSRDVSYRVERERGSLSTEDLESPGYFKVHLIAGRSVSFVASMEPWENLHHDAEALFAAEHTRLKQLVPRQEDDAFDPMDTQLVLAADQFIVFPGSRMEEHAMALAAGNEARTVIAGYHWFTDWGRDTMISLEGLTLCTGRHREARAILRTYANYVRDGLLPNFFAEGKRTGVYHTVDATLWYFHALDRYYAVTQDRDTLMMLYPILTGIMEHHLKGTRFGIGIDSQDCLLQAHAPGYALTWMDAKVGDWVVTPRSGKPVEIQALWYNAVRLMGQWAMDLGEPSGPWVELAPRIEESFNHRFWYASGGYLYDVVDGEGGNNPDLRPNQIFAVSLRYPVLHTPKWKSVVQVVREHLLTPFGLRSLERTHHNYKPMYFGDLRARDAAYHQGTVWAWLIGHFVDSAMKVGVPRAECRAMLSAFEHHLTENGIGTISEVFDGDAPFVPRGCIAQAFSVAEVLRAYRMTKEEGLVHTSHRQEGGSSHEFRDSAVL
ncbi:MAG: glycogen debranching protein [Nitrospira sp. WS238]|nr:glycogen debranching protein [Nitrospira sp. WS238]